MDRRSPDPASDGRAAARLSVYRFVSPGQASAALAARVVADLERSIVRRGAASLALSGGTTPGEFMTLLGYRSLDWRRIVVTLADERWVEPGNERSNAGLVARTLGRWARPYRWFPLWRAGMTASQALARVEDESRVIAWPLDVVVLGMGEDGHVASLFPGSDAGFGTGAGAAGHFVATLGPADEPRMSLTAAAIAAANSVYLLLKGRRKQEVLQAALGGKLPVARVLAARDGRIPVYASE